MFDIATSHPYSNNLPAIGDLATGHVIHYPFLTIAKSGAFSKRTQPCLVFDVDKIGSQLRAVIAPGVSELTGRKGGYDVDVNAPLEVLKAGLDHTTRFLGTERLRVVLAAQATSVTPATSTKIVGELSRSSMERLNGVRARIYAEKDIAAAIAAGTF